MSEAKSQKTKKVDKNIELMKIQVYSESVNSNNTTKQTFLLSVWVGLVILFFALYFEGVFQTYVFYSAFSVLTIIIFIYLGLLREDYKKALTNISLMIDEIEKGNKIPSLNDLLKKRK